MMAREWQIDMSFKRTIPPAEKSISATGPIRPPTLFPLLSLPFAPHIVPEDDSNQKAVTVKTDYNFKCYGFFWL